jgi:hypothetical protein
MPALTLHFWQGRDNAEDVVLLESGTPVDPSAVTRVQVVPLLKAGADYLPDTDNAMDSNTSPALFDWPVDVASGIYAGEKAVRLKLGESGLSQGDHYCHIVTFDTDNPNGQVWPPALLIKMA